MIATLELLGCPVSSTTVHKVTSPKSVLVLPGLREDFQAVTVVVTVTTGVIKSVEIWISCFALNEFLY